jgi:hypothetical protein
MKLLDEFKDVTRNMHHLQHCLPKMGNCHLAVLNHLVDCELHCAIQVICVKRR